MRSSDKSLFLLGLDRVAEAKLLAWNERISALMEKKLSIEGLTLAIDFFEVCSSRVLDANESCCGHS